MKEISSCIEELRNQADVTDELDNEFERLVDKFIHICCNKKMVEHYKNNSEWWKKK